MKKIYVFSVLLFAMLFSITTFSQQKEGVIKGIVTDETNAPLAGVSVSVKGTSRGTTSNADGAYTLAVEGPDEVLVFSVLGAQTREVKADGKRVINVTLVTSAKQLKDVVVIGYGTANKRDVTGSITTVKAEE